MRSLIGRRAPAIVAGVGVVISAAVSGCWNPPTRPQNQTPSSFPRSNSGNGSMSGATGMNNNPMSSSGAIPTPPNSGGANMAGMNPNGMNSNAMPGNGASNGTTYPNGMPMNRPGGMPMTQPNGVNYAGGPTSNQQMSGTPPFMNQTPSGGANAPIATNLTPNGIQPANFTRPSVVGAPIGSPIPSRDVTSSLPDPTLPPPNVMNNSDPKLFGRNNVPPLPTPNEALPLKLDDPLQPTPSSSNAGGQAPLSPPPLH